MSEQTYSPGDEVMFYGTKYTLLEPTGRFGWLACETDRWDAKPKLILSEYFRSVPPVRPTPEAPDDDR